MKDWQPHTRAYAWEGEARVEAGPPPQDSSSPPPAVLAQGVPECICLGREEALTWIQGPLLHVEFPSALRGRME